MLKVRHSNLPEDAGTGFSRCDTRNLNPRRAHQLEMAQEASRTVGRKGLEGKESVHCEISLSR
jgi:hypothetical protein